MTILNQDTLYRRKYPRRNFLRAIGFLFNGEYQVGTGKEIGEGGLALMLPQEVPLNKEAVVSFQIPDGSFICLRVEIRSCQLSPETGLYQIGCSFRTLKFDQKREIRSYVSARSEYEH